MNETDKDYILSQGFPEEALEDPTFIEAVSRPIPWRNRIDVIQQGGNKLVLIDNKQVTKESLIKFIENICLKTQQ